jgi:hypothetical protein
MTHAALLTKAIRVYDSCTTREQALVADNFMRLVRRGQPTQRGRGPRFCFEPDELCRAMARAHARCGVSRGEGLMVNA